MLILNSEGKSLQRDMKVEKVFLSIIFMKIRVKCVLELLTLLQILSHKNKEK